MIWWILGALAVGTTAAVVVSSSSTSDSAPTPFTDPTKYFAQIDAQTKAIQNLKDNRNAENDARVQSWKKAAKYIPVVGDYAGYLIDFGNWAGKVLGSNYAEQNSPDDLQHAADNTQAWLVRGYVPTLALFTEKDGAKNYAEYLGNTLAQIDALSDPHRTAIKSLGLMTIANSGKVAMQQGIADAASGNGSLKRPGYYGGKRVGATSIIAGIAASQFGGSYQDANDFALALDAKTPTGNDLDIVADIFIQTMQAASAGLIKHVTKSTDIVMAGRFDRSM